MEYKKVTERDGIIYLKINDHYARCPFKSRGVEGFADLGKINHSYCNSLCPHFIFEPGFSPDGILSLVTLCCVTPHRIIRAIDLDVMAEQETAKNELIEPYYDDSTPITD